MLETMICCDEEEGLMFHGLTTPQSGWDSRDSRDLRDLRGSRPRARLPAATRAWGWVETRLEGGEREWTCVRIVRAIGLSGSETVGIWRTWVSSCCLSRRV